MLCQSTKLHLFLTSSFLVSRLIVAGENPLVSMIETEKSFARTSIEKGMQSAFVAYLAEDSIIFRPGPVNGKKWFQDHPPSSGILSWFPTFGEVSAAGDLGISTGPYEYRKNAGENPASYGQFLSVWKKQPDGSWKVILDIGIDHPEPDAGALESRIPDSTSTSRSSLDSETLETERTLLLQTDRSLSARIESKGAAELADFFLDRSVVLRDSHLPLIGNTILPFLKASKGATVFEQDQGAISVSGDLGFVYGTWRSPEESGSRSGKYVRIWRKEGEWKVLVDLSTIDSKE